MKTYLSILVLLCFSLSGKAQFDSGKKSITPSGNFGISPSTSNSSIFSPKPKEEKKSDNYYVETFYMLKHNMNLRMKVINMKHHEELIEKGEIALKNNNNIELKIILSNLITNLDIKLKEYKSISDLSNKLGLE